MIRRLCVIGVGLIGGSVARAVRSQGLAAEIVGVDADPGNLRKALELGVIDRDYRAIRAGVDGADLVVLATPVGSAEAILRALAPNWSAGAVYTDVGSTKLSLVAAAERIFGRVPANLVPGHPIAGAESSGVAAARDDLYSGRRVILTPVPATDRSALNRVADFWKALGARVSTMAPDHHDEILAATSHLPHVLAFVLTEMLGRRDERQEIFQYAAGGFRDFTRIASSDPTMWQDICLANRAAILPLIEEYREALAATAGLLSAGDGEALFSLFARAREARQRFLDQSEK